MSQSEIKNIEEIAFKSYVSLSKSLGLPISTKLHKIMWHSGDHVKSFGCRRRGDTYQNETMHKATKETYRVSNKRIQQISTQILARRSTSQIFVSSEDF